MKFLEKKPMFFDMAAGSKRDRETREMLWPSPKMDPKDSIYTSCPASLLPKKIESTKDE